MRATQSHYPIFPSIFTVGRDYRESEGPTTSPNQMSLQIFYEILDDEVLENTESFTVRLLYFEEERDRAIVNITDNDAGI